MAAIKLGELLVKAKVLQAGQLQAAIAEQQRWGGKLGEILVRMSLITEELLVRALSKQLAIPLANVDAIQSIPPHVKSKIPVETARALNALPIELKDLGKTLVVAMAEPQNLQHLDTLHAISKCRIVAQFAGRTAIARAFTRFYQAGADLKEQEGSFKLVNALGETMLKKAPTARPTAGAPSRGAATTVPTPTAEPTSAEALALLGTVEDLQRHEIAALKALVEMLIEKGVFTRDEYLAKVRR
jgi:hypothetical protein